MFNQGQAYWYSYKTDKIYHAPDTHSYFIYNFKTKKIDKRKLDIFGIKYEEIIHIIKKCDSEIQALPEIKEWIINKAKAIRFGINTESIYFQVNKISNKTLDSTKKVLKKFKAPERIITLEDQKKLLRFDTKDRFYNKKFYNKFTNK